MAWIAGALAIGGDLLGGIGKQQENQQTQQNTLQDVMEQGTQARETSQFNAEQLNYYNQLKRQEDERGLDQFRKFSTVKNYAPNYVDTNPRVVVPNQPIFNQGAFTPTTAPSSGGGGGIGGLLGGLAVGGIGGYLLGGGMGGGGLSTAAGDAQAAADAQQGTPIPT